MKIGVHTVPVIGRVMTIDQFPEQLHDRCRIGKPVSIGESSLEIIAQLFLISFQLLRIESQMVLRVIQRMINQPLVVQFSLVLHILFQFRKFVFQFVPMVSLTNIFSKYQHGVNVPLVFYFPESKRWLNIFSMFIFSSSLMFSIILRASAICSGVMFPKASLVAS